MESKKAEQTQASTQAKPSRKGTLAKTTTYHNIGEQKVLSHVALVENKQGQTQGQQTGNSR